MDREDRMKSIENMEVLGPLLFHLELSYDRISSGLIILNENNMIIGMNQSFCRKYGISQKESIGTHGYKLFDGLEKLCKSYEPNDFIRIYYNYINEFFVDLLVYSIKNENITIIQVIRIWNEINN